MVYTVENILTSKREKAHVRRMLLYRADLDGATVEPRLLRASEHNDVLIEVVHAIHGIKEVAGDLQVQLEWSGLPDPAEYTWEPIFQVFEDLPGILEDFLHTSSDRVLKNRALETFYKSSTNTSTS